MPTPRAPLERLPRTDRVLAHPLLTSVRARLGRTMTKQLVRDALLEARAAVKAGAEPIDEATAVARVVAKVDAILRARSRRVINATGVILHTNLGRAPLSRAALEAVAEPGYRSLEVELTSGKRGGRGAFVESALASLSGAPAALVVNNNAAAVLLALGAIAAGRSVIVSRGELVEIGGGFRVHEVVARSGAKLVEVGTTNKTRADDFAEALDAVPDAAAVLRVHPGNFRQSGFVARPSLRELVALGRARAVPVIEDLGGGALLPLPGLTGDPLVRDSVHEGADLVTFSTDKILGGPQGGALVGAEPLVAAARRDPLHRALRLGRLPLAALEATLAAYMEGEERSIPAVAMVLASPSELEARAETWRSALEGGGVVAAVVRLLAVTGGGTYAEETLPSLGVLVRTPDPDGLVARLRRAPTPVLARIEDGSVVLDARTVLPDEDDALLASVRWALEDGPVSVSSSSSLERT